MTTEATKEGKGISKINFIHSNIVGALTLLSRSTTASIIMMMITVSCLILTMDKQNCADSTDRTGRRVISLT